MSELDVIVGQVVPAIGAAVGAYGAGVLTRVQNDAADATVGLGQRALQWIWRRAAQPAALGDAVADLAANAQDVDAIGALRLQVRKILTRDPVLVREVAAMLPPTLTANATGARSVAVTGDNSGVISTGDHASVIQLRGAAEL